MYISIDKQRMAICHRHPLRSVVNNLVTIELGLTPTSVIPDDSEIYFSDFTFSELRLLYENATGKKFTGFSTPLLAQQLLEVIKQLPIVDAVSYETAAQALAVRNNKLDFFQYVKGSAKPRASIGLFEPTAIKATGEEIIAALPAVAPVPLATLLPRTATPAPAAQITGGYPVWHPLHKTA